MDFPGGSDGKESTCNTGDLGSVPGSGRSPEEENGSSLKYSCLGNPVDRGAMGSQELDTTWQLNHQPPPPPPFQF